MRFTTSVKSQQGAFSTPPSVLQLSAMDDRDTSSAFSGQFSERSSSSAARPEEEHKSRNVLTLTKKNLQEQRISRSGITANQLKVDSVQFYGREKETQVLNGVFDSIFESSSTTAEESTTTETKSSSTTAEEFNTKTEEEEKKKGLVMISGYSGVGKSTLSRVVEDRVSQLKSIDDTYNRRCIFVSGKCDQRVWGAKPYEPFAETYSNFFREALIEKSAMGKEEEEEEEEEQNASLYEYLQESISSRLDTDEQHLLKELIPYFDEIISLPPAPSSMESTVSDTRDDHLTTSLDGQNDRVKYAFGVLTQILCSYFNKCLVMFLDDLQWTDEGTLLLLQGLLTDDKNNNPLLIIGTYRSNEVDDAHILSSTLREMDEVINKLNTNLSLHQENADSKGNLYCRACLLSKIHLENFGFETVHNMVSDLLSMERDKERTKSLAKICHERTEGNPFFLIEFVKMLEQQSLLQFNLGSFQWKWSEAEIMNKTSLTENVVDLLLPRMKRLPPHARSVLQIAGCLGVTFDVSSIINIWNGCNGQLMPANNTNHATTMTICRAAPSTCYHHHCMSSSTIDLLPP